jgi:hypothetical protein
MRERYEVWDTDAGSMIGTFATEHDALADVRGLLEVNGAGYADDLALARRREDGGTPIADGSGLALRARQQRPSKAAVQRKDASG